MSFTVNKVAVELTLLDNDLGWRTIKFEFVPRADDALTKMLLERSEEVAQARYAAPNGWGDLYIG